MTVTIRDVAKKAGCSIKTVSRVVNQELHVKPELRKLVLSVIDELGYVPNISARRLVQKRSYTICIMLHASGTFQSSLISKVLDLGYEGNYDILIQTYYPSFSTSRNKIAALINERRIDGLVTTQPCDSDPFLNELIKNSKLPHVHIAPLNPTGGTPYVSAEDYTGAYQMTERLIELGHYRIGLLMGLRNHRTSLDRLYGFRAAMEHHNLPFNEQLAVDSEDNFPGGYTAARILMGLSHAPSAIFALSDEAAAGALYALNELGIGVPAQVSLVSFGDMGFSHQIWPGITTVKYPIEKIVEQSVNMLIDLVEGRQASAKQVIFPMTIVERGSTAPKN
ncbi:MAG: hypothetical protein CVU39_05065 [Chloroflexi bacterium HGW-Chloroflexi-10]|nr:MAG: hypothetical protein CVU39_05065 [Chloroflexi bacterium HGW-Chloroflexi-10]